MPIIHNNIVCVTVDELVKCGFKEGTLYGYLSKQRTGEYQCWEHHVEKKKAFIHYDTLTVKNKILIQTVLCNGVEPLLWIENKEAEKLNRNLERVCSSLNNMVEVSPDEINTLLGCGLFSPQDVQRIARAGGWLRLWRKMSVKTARSYGFSSVTELQNEVFKRCLNEQKTGFVKFPKPINSERVLDRKAREYEKQGLDCLIGGYFGNANREKIDGTVHAGVMDVAGDPVKWSFEDIGLLYNTKARDKNLPLMTVSAIKRHLYQPKHV